PSPGEVRGRLPTLPHCLSSLEHLVADDAERLVLPSESVDPSFLLTLRPLTLESTASRVRLVAEHVGDALALPPALPGGWDTCAVEGGGDDWSPLEVRCVHPEDSLHDGFLLSVDGSGGVAALAHWPVPDVVVAVHLGSSHLPLLELLPEAAPRL